MKINSTNQNNVQSFGALNKVYTNNMTPEIIKAVSNRLPEIKELAKDIDLTIGVEEATADHGHIYKAFQIVVSKLNEMVVTKYSIKPESRSEMIPNYPNTEDLGDQLINLITATKKAFLAGPQNEWKTLQNALNRFDEKA